mmetsp:Transcript_16537/g.28673  ORF Transcript_16537/g.28673 Transcript_16537/m.28673 type:complete len:93 (-) Transcript_16537:565-843(-)
MNIKQILHRDELELDLLYRLLLAGDLDLDLERLLGGGLLRLGGGVLRLSLYLGETGRPHLAGGPLRGGLLRGGALTGLAANTALAEISCPSI